MKSIIFVQFRMVQMVKDKLLRSLYIQKSLGFKYSDGINFSSLNSGEENNEIDSSEIENCNLCNLYKMSDKKIESIGNKDSEVAILSTTTILNEAEQDILNKMISNVLQIDPKQLYFLSLLKCVIGEKVNYSIHEVERCKPFFDRQLASSNLKLIVTLGDAYSLLTNDNSEFNTVRGKLLQYNNYQVVPLYHPSFLLRNPSLKKDTFEDLKKIKSIMERM